MVQRLKHGSLYLDIGCCLGQDIRKLVADGVPSSHLYGAELQPEFIDLGYDFFQDRESLRTSFIQADVLDIGTANPLNELSGAFDFIHLGMVLHIYQWDQQRDMLERCVDLLKPESGVLILGQALGSADGGLSAGQTGANFTGKPFKHNATTFQTLWKEIGERTATKWDCRASIDGGLGVDSGMRKWDVSSSRRLVFEVERL